MLRRLIFLLLLLFLGLLFLARRGQVPAGMRAVESLLFPVFHKDAIARYAAQYQEDPLLLTSVIKVESNFFRKARSHRGAVGLMQIMPNTGREIAQDLKLKDFKLSDLEDPETNIHIGAYHLARLRREFGDHDRTILAAYNAGSKNAKDWVKKSGRADLDVDDIEFYETRKFVLDVLGTRRWLARLQDWRNRVLSWSKSR